MNFQEARNALGPILRQSADSRSREQAASLLQDIAFAEERHCAPDHVARRNLTVVFGSDSELGTVTPAKGKRNQTEDGKAIQGACVFRGGILKIIIM